MELEEYKKLSDIEKMRCVVNSFSYCNESFLMRFNVLELMKLYLKMIECDWDFLPDAWSDRQVREALKGTVPRWDNDENPVYTKKTKA